MSLLLALVVSGLFLSSVNSSILKHVVDETEDAWSEFMMSLVQINPRLEPCSLRLDLGSNNYDTKKNLFVKNVALKHQR